MFPTNATKEEEELSKFLSSQGWNTHHFVQKATETSFVSGLGEPDSYFIFVLNFQIEAVRKSTASTTIINDRFTVYADDKFCVVKDGDDLSLYSKI